MFQFEGCYRFPMSGPGSVRNPIDVPRSRYFLNENQNILAPEFCFGPGCPSETPAGFWDEEWCYVSQLATLPTDGAPVSNTQCQMDTDSDFFVRQVWPYIPGIPSGIHPAGNVVFRLRRGDGYAMSSNFIPVNSIRGALFKELKVKASDSLYFDAYLTDLTGAVGPTVPGFTAPVAQSLGFDAVPLTSYPNGGSGQLAVFSYGGNLYQVLQSYSNGEINIFKSTNGGVSWAAVAVGTGPTGLTDVQGGVYFDGVQTVTVATTVGSVANTTTGPIVLQDFDLATGTWGATYGAGSGNVYQINGLFKRSNGSWLVLCVNGIANITTAAYVRTSGGVWSHFSLDSLLPAGWDALIGTGPSAVYDPNTGTVHMFGAAAVSGGGAGNYKTYYQQILIGNTVAGFQDTTAIYCNQMDPLTSSGPPLIVGNQLLWGVAAGLNDTFAPGYPTYASILVGTPLSAPVFTVAAAPGVNPLQPIPTYNYASGSLPPVLGTDGVNLWAVFLSESFDGVTATYNLYISVASDINDPLSGWVGGIVSATGLVPQDTGAYTLSVIDGVPNITYEAGGGAQNNFFLKGIPPASIQFGLYLYGVKRKAAI